MLCNPQKIALNLDRHLAALWSPRRRDLVRMVAQLVRRDVDEGDSRVPAEAQGELQIVEHAELLALEPGRLQQ